MISQNYKTIWASVVTVAVAAALFMAATQPSAINVPKKETAYERVMRTRTLRCGYALWPVSEEIDPNTKQIKGLVPDYAEALGKKLGLKIEWVEEVQWGQQNEALNTGKIDAVCSDDGPWDYASATILDYAMPMAYIPIYLYGRKGETRFKTLEDVNSSAVTMSAIDGDISLAMAVDSFPKAHLLELPASDDPSFIMANVLNKKADLVLIDPLSATRFNVNNEEKLVRLNDTPLATMSISFSVAKNQGDLLNMLNQGFRLLQSLGISDQILDKYDPDHKLFYRPAKPWDASDYPPARKG